MQYVRQPTHVPLGQEANGDAMRLDGPSCTSVGRAVRGPGISANAPAPNLSRRTFLFSGRHCGYVEDPDVIAAIDRAYSSATTRTDCDVDNFVPVLRTPAPVELGCAAAAVHDVIEDIAADIASSIPALGVRKSSAQLPRDVLVEATADVVADLARQREFAHVSMQALLATAAAALAAQPAPPPAPQCSLLESSHQSHGPNHLCPQASATPCPGCSASKAYQVVHRHGVAPKADVVGGRIALDSFGPSKRHGSRTSRTYVLDYRSRRSLALDLGVAAFFDDGEDDQAHD